MGCSQSVSYTHQSRLAAVPGIINATPQGNTVRIIVPHGHPARKKLEDVYKRQYKYRPSRESTHSIPSRDRDASTKPWPSNKS